MIEDISISIPAVKQREIYTRIGMYLKNLQTKCNTCKGSGITLLSYDQFSDCPDCNGKFYEYRPYLLNGIPFDYVHMQVDDVKDNYTDKCYMGFKRICNSINDLLGNNIVYCKHDDKSWGVSTAGMIMIKKFLDNKMRANAVRFVELLDHFVDFTQDADKNKKNRDMFDYLSKLDALLIDDVDTTAISKSAGSNNFFLRKFMELIRQRKSQGKCTIITFNMTKDQIRFNYPEMLCDLLLKDSCVYPIQVKSPKLHGMEMLKKKNPILHKLFENHDDKLAKNVNVVKKGM